MEMYLNKEETLLVMDLVKLEMRNQLEFQFLLEKDISNKVEDTFMLMDCYKDVDNRLSNHLAKIKNGNLAKADFPASVIELLEVIFVETVKGDIPEQIKPSLEKNFRNILDKIKNSLTNRNKPQIKVNIFTVGVA